MKKFALLLAVCALVSCQSAQPRTDNFTAADGGAVIGQAVIANGARDNINVGVTSYRDMPFKTVKRQAYDYSCGSAAVATLMTYIYGQPRSEKHVFKAMFDNGDQKKIRREGFSMLDMANFMNREGLNAVGYKLTLDGAEKNKIPFIALINKNGYNHFVVVKSVKGNRVLVGDSNTGNVVYGRDQFQKMWTSGVALVVTNKAKKARYAFDNPKEWRYVRLAALSRGNYDGIDNDGLDPAAWQIAPAAFDIVGATTDAIATAQSDAINAGSGGLQ